MQQRLREFRGVMRGFSLIVSSTIEKYVQETSYNFANSDLREVLVKTSNSLVSKANETNLLKVSKFIVDRVDLLNRQNVIIIRSLIIPSMRDRFNTRSLCSSAILNQKGFSKGVDELKSNSGYSPKKNTSENKKIVNQPNNAPLPLSKEQSILLDKLNQRELSSKERRVPASRVGRIAGFGSNDLALSLGFSAATGWAKQKVGLSGVLPGGSNSNPFLTEANLERIVDTLCRMRGAALKLGQMLSIQDESLVSPQLQKIFERVRQAADFMPARQMRKVLASELGDDWLNRVKNFEEKPFAAASIGQVHKATLEDGRTIAMKIQYPGVVDSIDADINNLMSLLNRFNVLPRGLFAENAVEVAKRELKAECDYLREAEYCKRFANLLLNDPVFHVPKIIDELTTRRVLTAEYVEGLVLDDCKTLPQNIRNWLGEQLLRLCLEELFVYRVMQTDPNWSNFLYNPKTGKIVLLDFGASREFDKSFVDLYIRLIHAASQGNRDTIIKLSEKLGFLTGFETKVMIQAHVDAVSILGEAFASDKLFDFGSQSTTKEINHLIPIMLEHRLSPPPDESYSLHRKMSGCFLLCTKLKAVVNCHPLFLRIWNEYQFS